MCGLTPIARLFNHIGYLANFDGFLGELLRFAPDIINTETLDLLFYIDRLGERGRMRTFGTYDTYDHLFL